ncbi:hypothetical protein GCM10023325_22620 [Sphingomonas lutea]
MIAAAALAGCNNGDNTVVGQGADYGNNVASPAEVQLPPSIASSKVYRCADNDVVYVDWLSDGKSANVRTEQGGPPTQVVAPNPGEPMTAAGGYSIEGTATDASVTIAVPGQSAERCKA